MKVFKIENKEIYQGCGKVKAAIDPAGKVVDLLYKGQISSKSKLYKDWCVEQGFKSNRYTSKRMRMYDNYKSDCWYKNYCKEKEIFMKKNKGCQFLSGMASCLELVVDY